MKLQRLTRDTEGKWNTVQPVPSDKMKDVNCHKFVLFAVGKISWDEMVSDSRAQRNAGLDFTYGEKARALSDKEFIIVADNISLCSLANKCLETNKFCVGQIKDTETGEMAHSFIIEKTFDGTYFCYDKQGFKQYPFSVHSLETFLDFVNEKGQKPYQNQLWRFIPLGEIR